MFRGFRLPLKGPLWLQAQVNNLHQTAGVSASFQFRALTTTSTRCRFGCFQTRHISFSPLVNLSVVVTEVNTNVQLTVQFKFFICFINGPTKKGFTFFSCPLLDAQDYLIMELTCQLRPF